VVHSVYQCFSVVRGLRVFYGPQGSGCPHFRAVESPAGQRPRYRASWGAPVPGETFPGEAAVCARYSGRSMADPVIGLVSPNCLVLPNRRVRLDLITRLCKASSMRRWVVLFRFYSGVAFAALNGGSWRQIMTNPRRV